MRRIAPLLTLIGALLFITGHNPAQAAPHCVGNDIELQRALDVAAGNAANDEIHIQQGDYPTTFSSRWSGSDALTLRFGYDADCLAPSGVSNIGGLDINAPNAQLTIDFGSSSSILELLNLNAHGIAFIDGSGGTTLGTAEGNCGASCSSATLFSGLTGAITLSGQTPTTASTTGQALDKPVLITFPTATTTSQTLDVPLFITIPPGELTPNVNLLAPYIVAEGGDMEITAQLDFPASNYPVTIPYSISGSATAHDAIDGELRIDAGLSASLTIHTQDNHIIDSADRSLIITLGTPTNAVAGPVMRREVLITDRNLPPRVNLLVTQDGRTGNTVTRDGGLVTISAEIEDLNPGDSHRISWLPYDCIPAQGSIYDSSSYSFDPGGILTQPGFYRMGVFVSERNTPEGHMIQTEILLQIIDSLPSLSAQSDSDGDGLDDLSEGVSDLDGDAIPDYLDAINGADRLRVILLTGAHSLLRTNPGQRLRLGADVRKGGGYEPRLSLAEFEAMPHLGYTPDSLTNIGGLFDFELYDLPYSGATAQVVLPLSEPLPANAVYRKYHPNGGWSNFIEDANNSIASTTGRFGYCPPPGAPDYQPGLIAGHHCVQLTLEDGGPNDADKQPNGTIIDPGGIAQAPPANGGGGSTSPWLLLSALLLWRVMRVHLSEE